jgi:ubiquinone/menaquinone biosynthesis C-methylase UbiE
VNIFHRIYCRSDGWATAVQKWIMPWTLKDIALGDDVLEIGPGPGRTTEKLRESAARLTAIEIDHRLAEALKARLAGSNVTVVEGDATKMPFPDASFSGAVSLTMLHHVPSAALQDKLLAETFRVLRPGAVFAGSDSTPSFRWRVYHIMDTCVAVDPATFAKRLEAAGFADAHVETNEWHSFKFSARKPA